MSKWKTPAFITSIYVVIGAVIGGGAFKFLLSPRNQYACSQKLLDTSSAINQALQAQGFHDPCLNILGFATNGFDPIVLFIIGAVVMGVAGFLIGRYRSRGLA